MRVRFNADRGMAIAIAVGALLGLAPALAQANDSSAVLSAGGLELVESADISLLKEDLYISREEIRVHYEFRNATNQDIATIVAFPLPAIDLAVMSEVPIDYPQPDAENFVDFSVAVDGRPVTSLGVESRAMLNGRDIGGELAAFGVPILNSDPSFYDKLMALPSQTQQNLTARGIAIFDDYGAVYPQWTVQTAFYWTQVFPAGATVTVEHRYRPVVGTSFFSDYSLDDTPWLNQYCVDAPTLQGLRDRLADRAKIDPNNVLLFAYGIGYVLTTANNWAGPIGEFRLTIDKGSPDAIVSLCISGIRKTGPTTFVAEYKDFVPTEDLQIVIVEKPDW